MGWTLSDGYIASDDIGDTISDELTDLKPSCMYDFDRLVRDMAPRAVPKSVDCLAISDGWAFLIEFKRMPTDVDKLDEIKGSIRLKAVESLHICEELLDGFIDGRKLMLVVVDQDPRQEVTSALTFPDDSPEVPGYLRRYRGRDRFGTRLFFDEVALMHSGTFVRFANSRFDVIGKADPDE